MVRIRVDAIDGSDGRVDIFNVLGERVRHFTLVPQQTTELVWNAMDERGLPVSTGFYLVRLTVERTDGRVHQHTQRILYLK